MIKFLSKLFGISRASSDSRAQTARVERPSPKPFSNWEWRKSELEKLGESSVVNELPYWIEHYDGYVREAALTRAVDLRSPELYLAIVGRLNDWVPQVRRSARRALLSVLPSVSNDEALDSLPLVDRLLVATREDHSQFMEQFEAALLEKVGTAPIIDALQSERLALARSCFRVVCKYQLLPLVDLIERTIGSTKDIRTSLAALKLADQLDLRFCIELNKFALRSKFGAVRTVALRMLIGVDESNAIEMAYGALLDPQSSVRSAAIWHLGQCGIDVKSFYVQRLQHGALSVRDLRICLAALAVCGSVDEVGIIKSYLHDARPRIQAGALLACARLDKGARDEIVKIALNADVPRVRKMSVSFIDDFGSYIETQAAVDIALSKADHRLALVMARREPWVWLMTIVAEWTSVQQDSSLRAMLIDELKAWVDRATHVYQGPSTRMREPLASPSTRNILKEMLSKDPGRQRIMEHTLSQF